MSYEFKKISEVDILETVSDEAHVLVEEAGAIKRVSKTEVGGNGKADLVIKLNAPINLNNPTAENTIVTIESGSLQAVVDVLKNGEAPVVQVHHFYAIDESIPIIEGGVYNCNVVHYGELLHFSFAIPTSIMMKISMSIDDPDYLEVWAYPLAMTTMPII